MAWHLSQAGTTVGEPVSLDRQVRQSLRYCRRITRKHAGNFYYGMMLTPQPQRGALYATYAFMRACDDLVDSVDSPGQSAQDGRGIQRGLETIETFRSQMQQVLDGGPLPDLPARRSCWPAFRYVMSRFPVDPQWMHDMLDGQRLDLLQKQYQTFDQLYDYCYKVASVVGMVCISIWGWSGDSSARKLAEYRGIAFQLTNILRDLVEDAQRQRVYLPAEELERFGCDFRQLGQYMPGPGFDRLMTFQIERARSYYDLSAGLEQHIEPACQSTSWALMRIYRGLLEKIAEQPRQVLHQRVRLRKSRKLSIALQAMCRRPTRPRTVEPD